MSSPKEIKSKIGSINKTQKITKAMQMVSAGKMRRTQDRMSASRPYAEKILQVIHHLACAHPEYHHPYVEAREVKRVGFIIVTTDRGLCGALNMNLLKEVVLNLKNWQEKGIEQDLCLLGTKADAFFRHYGGNIIAKASRVGDETGLQDLIGAVRVMLDAYDQKKIDVIYVCFNRFVNTMKQDPMIQQLVPLEATGSCDDTSHWDYIYEPDSKELLNQILTRYIESQVYQSVLENSASEQAARMVAMKTATDNAVKLVDNLNLEYNKARQAAITNEISDIVGGAAAINQ